MTEAKRTRAARNALAAGCLALPAVLLVMVAAFLAWANAPLPPEEADLRHVPQPNGYDACTVALKRLAGARDQADPSLGELRRAIRLEFVHPSAAAASRFPIYSIHLAARRFVAESAAALKSGHTRDAIGSTLDAIELGSRIGVGGNLFCHAKGHWCAHLGIVQAERCVPHLSPQEARAAGTRLERIARQFPGFARGLREERRLFLSRRRRLLSQPELLAPMLRDRYRLAVVKHEVSQRILCAFYPKPADYGVYDRHIRALLKEAEKPSWRRDPAAIRKRMIQGYFDPVGDWDGTKHAHYEARIRLLRLQLALHDYRHRHGRYPEGLDRLSEVSPELAVDPFSGTQLRYRTLENGYRLYSVGPNRIDDGGATLPGTPRWRVRHPDVVAGPSSEREDASR